MGKNGVREHCSNNTGISRMFPRAAKRFLAAVGIVLLVASVSWAGQNEPMKPGPRDKCPVCGMFVAKYPDFASEIIFRDGRRVFFDGVKDMMKYYLDLKKYNPAATREDIAAVSVTDYYSLEFVDGFTAFYVIDSDVYGPMGRELIPFAKKAEAEEFKRDHKGKSLLSFKDIEISLVMGLDR